MHQRILIKSTKNILYISETKIEEGILTSLHSHPNLEIILIIKGEGAIHTTKDKINVKEKDMVIINPNSKHCETGLGLTFYAIGISNLDLFLNETFKAQIINNSLNKNDFASIKCLYDIIYNNAINIDEYSLNIIDESYEIILNTLKRKYLVKEKENYESDIVLSIKNIIDNYYSSEIKLSDIAKRLNMSVSSICHLFKESEKETIINYKISKQLNEAKNLLEISDMTITEISDFVGFNNASYFIKKFDEAFHITPSKYRLDKETHNY